MFASRPCSLARAERDEKHSGNSDDEFDQSQRVQFFTQARRPASATENSGARLPERAGDHRPSARLAENVSCRHQRFGEDQADASQDWHGAPTPPPIRALPGSARATRLFNAVNAGPLHQPTALAFALADISGCSPRGNASGTYSEQDGGHADQKCFEEIGFWA